VAVHCVNSTTPRTPVVSDPPRAPPDPPPVVKLIVEYKFIVCYDLRLHCRMVTPQRGKRMADEPIAGSPDNEAVRAPYRLVVWGTGGMGRVALSTVATRKDFEIIGARVYSADKDGIDVGALAGLAPVGVRATADLDAALAIDADCVLHLARDFGRYDSVDELVAILRAGRNVITVHPFQLSRLRCVTASPGLGRLPPCAVVPRTRYRRRSSRGPRSRLMRPGREGPVWQP
jgi:Dihydrodipicolinate reductase, N-terminus